MNWISVNDQLPELTEGYRDKDYSKDVLVWNGSQVGVGYYSTSFGDRWKSYMETESDWYGGAIHPAEVGDITHWMPMPAPPK